MQVYNISDGYNLYVDKTDKFKNVTINIIFTKEVADDLVYWYAMAYMLEDRCLKYNTKQKVRNYLDSLYGAKISVKTKRVGNHLRIQFSCNAINGKFVKEDILSKQILLLKEFIFNTLLYNDEVAFSVLDEVKNFMRNEMYYIMDNPGLYTSYQVSRLYDEYNDRPKGFTLSDIEKMDIESIRSKYEYMVNHMNVDAFVIGDIDQDSVYRTIKENLYFENHDVKPSCVYNMKNKDFVDEVEVKSITQSTVSLVYKTGYEFNLENYCNMLVFDGILGALPTSLLFQNVREKNSLCYSIYSFFDTYAGSLTIETSCATENIERILEVINEQIDVIKNCGFADELLIKTKKSLSTNLLKKLDSPVSHITNMYLSTMFSTMFDTDSVINQISKVEKEDVIAIANRLELIIRFVLKGRSDNND